MTPPNLFRRLRGARLATVMLGLLIAAAAPKLYAQVRIGVIDIHRAVSETNEGRAASVAIKAHFDERQTDLDHRTKTLEATKARLEKATQPTTPEQQRRLQKEVQDFQQGALQLQQLGQQYTSEIQQMEADMTKTILTRMQPLVRQIALGENYQIIVDEGMVHYAPSNANLTDRVIQTYNQQYPANPNVPAHVTVPHVQGPAPTGPDATQTDTTAPSGPTGPSAPSTAADAGHHALPGVFFRRDAGH